MRSELLEDPTAAAASLQQSRLLAKKSSYQAWKCVSFGCSLLALLLLLSKWQEVSSDLQLLLNIQHLVGSASSNNGSSSSITAESSEAISSQQWPPSLAAAADSTAPPTNETNHNHLVSHMQVSVGREIQGNQLLKREVETFIAEFRGAKSTLSLSSLLVSVYIISWILMTLAINDARISNDISIRNILLLAVFGAIDLAASLGFVLVRLIMYSVKNNSFRGEMLASASFREAPIKMAPDQLTAFTALRLIAMRSCSAYMDIYVSFIVVLLTVLRLYAILQAIAYYRHLRRSLSGAIRYIGQELLAGRRASMTSLQQQQRPHWSPDGGLDTPDPSKQVWSIFPQRDGTFASHNTMISGQVSGQVSPQMQPQPQQQFISQHPSYQQYTDDNPITTDKRPASRTSWQRQQQQQQQANQLRPAPPQRLPVGNNRNKLRKLNSRSPSPVREKFEYLKRQQEPPAKMQTASMQKGKQALLTNTLRGSDGTTYTLLSANQLERISRKLLEATQSSDANNNNNNLANKQQIKTSRESNQVRKRHQQQQKDNNNFELLLTNAAAAAAAAADDLAEQSTGSSSLALADDDDDNDSDLSQGGDSTGAGRRRPQMMSGVVSGGGGGGVVGGGKTRLVSVSNLRPGDGGADLVATTGYLIAEQETSARKKHQHQQQQHELSASAKNKLLLGEYFYA